MLLQIQQRFGHLLYIEYLRPALIASAFALSQLCLNVDDKARTLAFAARQMLCTSGDSSPQLGLRIALTE